MKSANVGFGSLVLDLEDEAEAPFLPDDGPALRGCESWAARASSSSLSEAAASETEVRESSERAPASSSDSESEFPLRRGRGRLDLGFAAVRFGLDVAGVEADVVDAEVVDG